MAADVIVVGLGAAGSAAAFHLTTRGLRVLGLDRFQPPHDLGAHTGGSRIIRQAYAEGADYVPLVLRSYELWRELEAVAGARLLTVTGGLMIGRPESWTVAGALASARAHGLDHETLDAAAVRRSFPALQPADDEVGVYEAASGVLRPEASVEAHLTAAAREGADLRFGADVVEWSAGAGRVQVRTAEDTYDADRLVLCPGAGAPPLLATMGVPLVVERQVQHYWLPDGDGARFAVGRCPIWLWEDAADAPVGYGLPMLDGAVKTAFHHAGAQTDPDHVDREVHEDEIALLRRWLSRRAPGLAGRWLRGRVCLYTNTPDRHFVVARHPEHAEVVVACGFSGHGFKFAPVIGEILADLSLTGGTRHPIDLFAPDRFVA